MALLVASQLSLMLLLRPDGAAGVQASLTREYQFRISGDVASVARDLPGYAGMYFDHAADGRAVVLLTAATAASDAALRSAAAGDVFDVKQVPHSYSALQSAIATTWQRWEESVEGGQPIAIALNTIANGIDIYVGWVDLAAVANAVDDIERMAGVPVQVLGSDPVSETACNDREHCTSPERAGIVIHRGSPTSTAKCTMAFHVRYGSDEQFVTAGHCGYGSSQSWYHQGLPSYAMAPRASLLFGGGIDMRRINLLDSQASAIIYPNTYPVGGWRWPLVGENVFVSAGVSDRVVENIVQDDYLTWTSPSCGCVVSGAKMTSTPGGASGDSGSPVFIIGLNKTYAIGTGSGTLGSSDIFARMGDAVNRWGITLVTG
ncbi:MAG TPA: hypothetical protein VHR55_08825 [Candidatus Limnocylindria bacterium]|nr:hypothetical protein [Candidatus Limnocylindria bacterium]